MRLAIVGWALVSTGVVFGQGVSSWPGASGACRRRTCTLRVENGVVVEETGDAALKDAAQELLRELPELGPAGLGAIRPEDRHGDRGAVAGKTSTHRATVKSPR